MELFSEKDRCCGCSACADVCPTGAIQMEQDKEGFSYPRIEKNLCIDCGRCREICPMRKEEASFPQEKSYIGMQADDEFRLGSSSGGAFPVLAEYIFDRQGKVYGAAYNEDMEVVHRSADSRAQLESLRRTKYVQSKTEGIYREIERLLKEGRWILFCGTPCQAQALRLYLKREYSRLVIVDLICYGVPSPGIWNSYVRYLEQKHRGRMRDFSFRDKRNRDNGHVCSYKIGDIEYTGSLYEDIFCRLYFKNYILRPSCSKCKFCTTERSSDFTIGDFWGIEGIRKDMDDGMGTSAVILHTHKAKEIWDDVKEKTRWFACEKEEILQPRLISPTQAAKKRNELMNLYRTLPFPAFLKLAGGLMRLWECISFRAERKN